MSEPILKASRLLLSGASRLLMCRAANMGVMALYGDTIATDVWSAALRTLVSVPLPDLASRPKLAREVFSASHALLYLPVPLPHGAHPILSGVAETSVPLVALSTSLPCPRAVAMLMLQPMPIFAAFIARTTCVLDAATGGARRAGGARGAIAALLPGSGGAPGQRLGSTAILHALSALEAVLTLEAEARALPKRLRNIAAAREQGAPAAPAVSAAALAAALASNALCHAPSGIRISPAAAAGIVTVMDAHVTTSPSPADALAMSRAFAAGLGGALPRGGSGDAASGLFGVSFIVALLLAGARDPSHFTWPVSRALLPAMLCRPSVFGAAAEGLANSCAPEHADAVRHASGDLGVMTESLGDDALSDEGKDAFSRAFAKWTRVVGDKL